MDMERKFLEHSLLRSESSMERKFLDFSLPGSECSTERKFHGSESSLYGLFVPGNESAEERKGQLPCSLLLIYLPRKDERLSRPGWLTYSGRFTHISGHPSVAGRAQDRESSPVKDDVLTYLFTWFALSSRRRRLIWVRVDVGTSWFGYELTGKPSDKH